MELAKRGLLVVVEGIDGADKSSLIPVLAQAVREAGRVCTTSREPTDGPYGRKLRESARTGRLPLAEELALFLEDRRQHVAEVIQPALARGEVVLLDRYYYSTAAYQGARGADPAEVIAANEAFAPRPDLVLILDLDPAQGLGRVRARGDVPDAFERVQELQRAQEIFRAFTGKPFVHVAASQAPHFVQARAQECLKMVTSTKTY